MVSYGGRTSRGSEEGECPMCDEQQHRAEWDDAMRSLELQCHEHTSTSLISSMCRTVPCRAVLPTRWRFINERHQLVESLLRYCSSDGSVSRRPRGLLSDSRPWFGIRQPPGPYTYIQSFVTFRTVSRWPTSPTHSSRPVTVADTDEVTLFQWISTHMSSRQRQPSHHLSINTITWLLGTQSLSVVEHRHMTRGTAPISVNENLKHNLTNNNLTVKQNENTSFIF